MKVVGAKCFLKGPAMNNVQGALLLPTADGFAFVRDLYEATRQVAQRMAGQGTLMLGDPEDEDLIMVALNEVEFVKIYTVEREAE